MSLLIEALRQAEARKKPAPADDAGAAAAAAPASTPESEPRSAPALALEPIETAEPGAGADIAGPAMPGAAPAPPSTGPAATTTSPANAAPRPASGPPPHAPAAASPRRQAQTVLSASIGAGTPRRGPGRLLAGLAVLIAISLGGAWWFLATQTGGSLQATLPPPEDAVAGNATSTATDADVDGMPPAVPTAATADIDATATATTPAIDTDAPTGAAAEPAALATAEPRPAAPPASPSPLAPTSGDAVALRRHEAPVVTRGVSRAGALAQGYEALQADRLDEAEAHYTQALRLSPRHPDALLGLGAIAERRGDIAAAVAHYRRVLQVEPEHPVALAALAEHVGGADPLATESRLRSALAAQPQAAPLHFALGNRLAEEGRWSEAQQAYFQAHVLAPDNADYAFNLAVALDRLRKPTLAAEHYRRALALAAGGAPHAFDPAAAQRRLRAIEAATAAETPAR
jgi:tetratricopeptide (TPR) repeat protein